jgi:hypothetical protein
MLSQRFPVDILGGDKWSESVSLNSKIVTMFGWLRAEAIRASCETLHPSFVGRDIRAQILARRYDQILVLSLINFTHSTGAFLNDQL